MKKRLYFILKAFLFVFDNITCRTVRDDKKCINKGFQNYFNHFFFYKYWASELLIKNLKLPCPRIIIHQLFVIWILSEFYRFSIKRNSFGNVKKLKFLILYFFILNHMHKLIKPNGIETMLQSVATSIYIQLYIYLKYLGSMVDLFCLIVGQFLGLVLVLNWNISIYKIVHSFHCWMHSHASDFWLRKRYALKLLEHFRNVSLL